MAEIPSEPQEPKRDQSLAVRLLTAFAFSTVGAKLGFLGMPADVAALYPKGTPVSERTKGLTNGTMIHNLQKRMEQLVRHEGRSPISAMLIVTKYSTGISIAAAAAGAVIGWIRGGRVEHWKDIIKHPWRSTKLILGLESPPAPQAPALAIPPEDTPPTPATTRWQEKIRAEAVQASPEESLHARR